LETIDAQHPDTVALLVGPIVLFAVTDAEQPAVTRAQLLTAKKMDPGLWHVTTGSGIMKLLAFTEIQDQPYTTYLRVS
jgi:hypothetical protein